MPALASRCLLALAELETWKIQVSGLGFRVQGLEFRVLGLGFRVVLQAHLKQSIGVLYVMSAYLGIYGVWGLVLLYGVVSRRDHWETASLKED